MQAPGTTLPGDATASRQGAGADAERGGQKRGDERRDEGGGQDEVDGAVAPGWVNDVIAWLSEHAALQCGGAGVSIWLAHALLARVGSPAVVPARG